MTHLMLLLPSVCIASNFQLDSFNCRSGSPGLTALVTG